MQPLFARIETTLHRCGSATALDALLLDHPAAQLTRLGDALEARLGPVILDEGARIMNADELRALTASNVSLGGHTVDHVVLPHESPDRARAELEEPRRFLEEITGQPCRSFAYCNGLWHPHLVAAVRAAGYDVAVTTRDAPNVVGQDPLLVGRKTIWEGHADGFAPLSDSLLIAHLHDLFGDLALRRPTEGRVTATPPMNTNTTTTTTEEAR
jgi:hypothetical protein